MPLLSMFFRCLPLSISLIASLSLCCFDKFGFFFSLRFVCNFRILHSPSVYVYMCVCESLLNSNLIVALVFVAKVGHSDAGRQSAACGVWHVACASVEVGTNGGHERNGGMGNLT